MLSLSFFFFLFPTPPLCLKHGLDFVLVPRIHALSFQRILLLGTLEYLAQRKLSITCYPEFVRAPRLDLVQVGQNLLRIL